MKEYDIIKAAVSADMPDIEAVRRKIVEGEKRRRGPSVKWVGGIAVALVLAAGIFVASQHMPPPHVSGGETADVGVGDPNGTGADEQGGSSICGADIHINNRDGGTMTDLLARWVETDISELPEEFQSIANAEVPKGFMLDSLGAYYLPDGVYEEWSPDNYTILHSYTAMYSPIDEGSENSGDWYVTVGMSYIYKPILGCCTVVGEYDEASYIGDTEVMIYGCNGWYSAQFEYGGAYYGIDAMGITEADLVLLINGFMK